MVSFLSRKSTKSEAVPVIEPVEVREPVSLGKKGAPTPKRREKEVRRGPVAPPPRTQREALKRSKTTSSGKTLTKDERRAANLVRREAMMRGDQGAVLPRDRGPVRQYVRDLVDARRNLAGLLLPIALLSFVTLMIPSPAIQLYAPLVLMVFLLAAIADGVVFGRQITRKAAAKFPKGDPSGQSMRGRSLGYYAFQRAMLIRRWRAPRATKRPGDSVD